MALINVHERVKLAVIGFYSCPWRPKKKFVGYENSVGYENFVEMPEKLTSRKSRAMRAVWKTGEATLCKNIFRQYG